VKEREDIKVGIILLISSFVNYFVIIPRYVKGHAFTGLSPSFFPKLATILLGILSLVLILNRWYSIRNKKKRGDEKKVEIVSYKNYIVTIITIILAAIYFILFKYFGFLWATPIMLALLMVCFGARNLKVILFICIVVTLTLFFLFEKGLGIPLH